MVKKIIFFLAWLGIFFISILGVVFTLAPNLIKKYNCLSERELTIVIFSISLLFFIVTLYKFLSLFEKNKDFKIVTSDGSITISTHTINVFVYEILSKDKELKNIKVESKRKSHGVEVNIKLDIHGSENLADKISSIQEEIKSKLYNSMSVNTTNVIVNVAKLSVTESKRSFFSKSKFKKEDEDEDNDYDIFEDDSDDKKSVDEPEIINESEIITEPEIINESETKGDNEEKGSE